MKLHLLIAALSLALCSTLAYAEKSDAVKKTVTGTSACATCEGVTDAGHHIMLVDKAGVRWVLVGEGDGYKKAHTVRQQGKKMTATLAGEPQTKKDAAGKEFKEVKVSEVTVG